MVIHLKIKLKYSWFYCKYFYDLGADNVDSRNEEMTDSVTDELEKLQQEGDSNNIGEVDGVNGLLGDLDDDDELLGNLFTNISNFYGMKLIYYK